MGTTRGRVYIGTVLYGFGCGIPGSRPMLAGIDLVEDESWGDDVARLVRTVSPFDTTYDMIIRCTSQVFGTSPYSGMRIRVATRTSSHVVTLAVVCEIRLGKVKCMGNSDIRSVRRRSRSIAWTNLQKPGVSPSPATISPRSLLGRNVLSSISKSLRFGALSAY